MSSRNECISSVLPAYRCLQTFLIVKETDPLIIKSFKRVVANGLKSRMDKYEHKRLIFNKLILKTNKLRFLIIATLIDPRYKNHQNIFNYGDRIQNKAILQSEVELFINPERRFYFCTFKKSF